MMMMMMIVSESKSTCLIIWTLNWNTHYESQGKCFDILRHIITRENEIFS